MASTRFSVRPEAGLPVLPSFAHNTVVEMNTSFLVVLALLVTVSLAAPSKDIRELDMVRKRSNSNVLQDILAQIGHLTKDTPNGFTTGDAAIDEQSRYFGEILDEYRKKYGFPRMEPRQSFY
ncbi:hypothetical protein L596_023481 [Steinernema carpocapsae]|uniref:Uncharacterized protein n=2 Tax=Steinernema carpocapsae TaxID=34508 RepID=A0A4V5ZZE8_STECR|nr:hypothetical protein L596_023481 [Steinernema carpocapsae]